MCAVLSGIRLLMRKKRFEHNSPRSHCSVILTACVLLVMEPMHIPAFLTEVLTWVKRKKTQLRSLDVRLTLKTLAEKLKWVWVVCRERLLSCNLAELSSWLSLKCVNA